ncbi:hypothetical protein [Streptomyces sp. NPDC008092]|uniref:hypothetical protein n=1 Tax=Streptomyces sp. NPDC008092 TaxID=3364808 RepID=UPI0036E6A842
MRWRDSPAAALALVSERARPRSLGEAARFWATQRSLHAGMPEYRDDLIAIAGPACPLMPAPLPRQFPTTRPKAALPVPV